MYQVAEELDVSQVHSIRKKEMDENERQKQLKAVVKSILIQVSMGHQVFLTAFSS